MARGKWAQGIEPRGFQWVIQDQLAICERPGGFGPSHRKVRRQEEVIWIRRHEFSYIVSLIPSDHNLHTYDEEGMPWLHWPFAPKLDLEISLPTLYDELQKLLGDGKKLLLHIEEVGDRLAGLMAGYLVWTQMVPRAFDSIMLIEKMLSKQMGPVGREIATASEACVKVKATAGGVCSEGPVLVGAEDGSQKSSVSEAAQKLISGSRTSPKSGASA